MEYATERRLEDIAPLLERLDRGEKLTAEEQAELTAIRSLDGPFWKGELPQSSGVLTALKSLDLWEAQVCDLTPLSGLTALKSLKLDDTQVSDLTPLSGLTALETLDMDGTQVSNLTPLRGLTGLESLDLRHTRVSDLTPLSDLTALQYLDLSGTQVKNLTPVSGLKKLEGLLLRTCSLRAIPRELYERFEDVYVYDTYRDGLILTDATLSTQPISIFRERDEVIRAYYDAPKKAVRESKVIFLGDGGAGKTHTIKRILNEGKDDSIGTDATLGIAIQPYTAYKGRPDEFKINFWDFGGQEIYHWIVGLA